MKKLILTILISILSIKAFANVSNFTPSDNFITTNATTTNYSTNTCYGAGCSPNKTIQANDAYIMKYNLASISGQTALHAYLNVYLTRGGQHNLTIYRMLQDFTASQSTWTVYSTGNNWNTAGASGSGTDYTTTNATTFAIPPGSYIQVDVTNLVNDCLTNGNTCDLLMRWPSTSFDKVVMAHDSTNPPYLTVATSTVGVPNLWYVRDGGGTFGQTSGTCNGTANTLFNGSNGPNCAVNHPNIIVGNGNSVQWSGGDIMYVDGDSDRAYDFTVSGITTGPAIGDTYTNNGHTYTVTVPLPTGQTSGKITMDGAALAPSSSGTLTRTAGSGDSAITFSAEGAAQAIYKITSTLNIPGGISGQQTKIIGTGNHWPQFWADAFLSIDASASHIDLENIDLTGHDDCIINEPIGVAGATVNADGYLYVCNHGGTSSYGNGGLQWGGTDLTIENMDIHNMQQGMVYGIQSGVVGNNTFTNLKVFGNSEQGAIYGGFNGQTITVMTGLISLINSQIDFNGCAQRYPLQDNSDIYSNIANTGFSQSIDNEANYYNCWGQNQGGYGDGFGYGGGGTAGNWFISGSSVSFNTQDGVDTLHGNSNGITTAVRSRFEGNAGQQLKVTGNTIYVQNNLINGDCARWIGASETSTTYGINNQNGSCTGLNSGNCGFNIGIGDHGQVVCRANGSTVDLLVTSGTKIYYYNNTITTSNIAFEIDGSGCDSTTSINLFNNIVLSGGSANNDGQLFPGGITTGNEQYAAYIYDSGSDGDGSGACGYVGNGSGGTLTVNEDYNLVYSAKNNNQGCNGSHDLCGTNPGFSTTIPNGSPSGAVNTYYHGTAMMALEPLLSTSFARGAASFSGLTYSNGTNDFNNYPANTPPDLGGLQYGSNPQSCSGLGASCSTNQGCCSNFCVTGSCAAYNCGDGVVTSPEVCDGSNLNNQTCVTQGYNHGTISCNSGCLSFNTSSCVGTCNANTVACSANSDCCSGFCVSSFCAAYNCGDGTITSPEVCDGSNLNGNTCSSVGAFTGGTLSCNANCLSFNTSSCIAQSNVSLGFGGNIGAH